MALPSGAAPGLQDAAPKVNAFRNYCLQITEQLCAEFEREVAQLTNDVLRYRAELARCADLLAFQLGKEKQYHVMLENIAGNTSALVGRASEVGQKHHVNEPMKQQMHQMLEQMLQGSTGAFAEGFGNLDECRQMAESHLMTSAQLQNQSEAVQKELSNILETLNMPPVTYSQAPTIRPQTPGLAAHAAPGPGVPVYRPGMLEQTQPGIPPHPGMSGPLLQPGQFVQHGMPAQPVASGPGSRMMPGQPGMLPGQPPVTMTPGMPSPRGPGGMTPPPASPKQMNACGAAPQQGMLTPGGPGAPAGLLSPARLPNQRFA
eukprot:TRINITY_DN38161_c0_g2_i1.p1 TRINITY_DN38161_c0_g2~~TRINITY_DN38161_c0_g2_i1.p1  ORF type:complete len:334 (+),score=64.69 TRINITY_DN38161_c0_g2_i1:54-1004(+)